jgi:hypothetical protein
VNNEFEGFKECSPAQLMYLPALSWMEYEELQNNWCPGRDSNRMPPEYMFRSLLLRELACASVYSFRKSSTLSPSNHGS